MKKLVLFLGLVCFGNLFAAAAEDVPTVMSTPQRTILDVLPKEVIEQHIFPYLSYQDQTAFTSVNRYAHTFKRNYRTVCLDMNADIELVGFLKKCEHNVFSLKITNLYVDALFGNSDVLEEALSLLGEQFKLNHLMHLDLSKNRGGLSPLLLKFVSRMPLLRNLDFTGNYLRGTDMQMMRGPLHNLRILSVGQCYSDTFADSLSGTELSHITELDVHGMNWESWNVLSILELENLRVLKIQDNKIGDKGAEYLARSRTLETLDISNNRISYEGVLAIARGLPDLRKLTAEGNYLGAAAEESLRTQLMPAILLQFTHTVAALPEVLHPPLMEHNTLLDRIAKKICGDVRATIEERIYQLLPRTIIAF